MRAVALSLLWLLVACGGGAADVDADPGAPDAPCFDCGACQPSTFATDCAVRACEVATGCVAGECQYGAIECGQQGRVCPVETCRSREEMGAIVNECVIVPAAPCGVGGMCRDNECVVPPDMLGLEGGLQRARTVQQHGTLLLDGEVSVHSPGAGPRWAGSTRLTGGIQ